MNNNNKNNVIMNGVSAELLSSSITYPLNTIKINSQVGKSFKLNIKNLSRGFGWSLITELTSALIFYSIFENLKEKHGPLKGSIVGSVLATSMSYPFNVKRKLIQIRKNVNIPLNEVYKGVNVALINSVPGTVINFTLREIFKEKLPDHLKPISGLLSTAISLVTTHPLDTISTRVATRTPIRLVECLNYNGFKERFFEKNLTIGGKMVLLDLFNKNN